MSTYLDLQTAGSHLFPVESRDYHWLSGVAGKIRQLREKLDRERTHDALRGMSDRMLRDIGVDRSMLNG